MWTALPETANASDVPTSSDDDDEHTRRVECSCGAMLHLIALPYGDVRGTFRKRCWRCGTQWRIPFAELLDGADPSGDSTFRLGSSTPNERLD